MTVRTRRKPRPLAGPLHLEDRTAPAVFNASIDPTGNLPGAINEIIGFFNAKPDQRRSEHDETTLSIAHGLAAGRWRHRMKPPNLSAVEVKALVPARDFALSMQFYEALGFTRASVPVGPKISLGRCETTASSIQAVSCGASRKTSRKRHCHERPPRKP